MTKERESSALALMNSVLHKIGLDPTLDTLAWKHS